MGPWCLFCIKPLLSNGVEAYSIVYVFTLLKDAIVNKQEKFVVVSVVGMLLRMLLKVLHRGLTVFIMRI